MMMTSFDDRKAMLEAKQRAPIEKPNVPILPGNGIFVPYENLDTRNCAVR